MTTKMATDQIRVKLYSVMSKRLPLNFGSPEIIEQFTTADILGGMTTRLNAEKRADTRMAYYIQGNYIVLPW